MFYAVSWFFVLGLLALWSLTAWFVHAVGAWAVSSAGSAVEAAATSGVAVVQLPGWLTSWIPTELVMSLSSMVSAFSPILTNLPDPGPVITNGWAVLILVVWAIGSLVLVACGALAHTLKARWRRPGSPPSRGSTDLLPV